MLTTRDVVAVYLERGIEDSALELEICRVFAATGEEPKFLAETYPALWSLRQQLRREVEAY